MTKQLLAAMHKHGQNTAACTGCPHNLHLHTIRHCPLPHRLLTACPPAQSVCLVGYTGQGGCCRSLGRGCRPHVTQMLHLDGKGIAKIAGQHNGAREERHGLQQLLRSSEQRLAERQRWSGESRQVGEGKQAGSRISRQCSWGRHVQSCDCSTGGQQPLILSRISCRFSMQPAASDSMPLPASVRCSAAAAAAGRSAKAPNPQPATLLLHSPGPPSAPPPSATAASGRRAPWRQAASGC